jgi:nucleoside-diphosphate-sugar epimerase
MHVVIAGCGWLGSAVARRLLARGDRVTGIRSDPERAEQLRPLGIEPLVLDLADPSAGPLPSDTDAILALQSARGGGEASYRRAYLDVNRTLLAWARQHPVRALVHTGSTGIFEQRDGSEVDEATRPAPVTPAGAVLLEAETMLMEAAAAGIPARILRLSGLYGPGRLWLMDRVARGLMALGPGDDAWMNFCHQEDAMLAVLAVLDRGRDGAIYHATDEQPMRRREVITWVAGRLGIPLAPASGEAPPSAPNRRILGERTRRELEIQLKWPSLKQGLEPFLNRQ